MTSRTERRETEARERRARNAVYRACLGSADKSNVAEVVCDKCLRVHEQGLDLAVADILSGVPLLCCDCDKDPAAPSVATDAEKERRRVEQIIYDDEHDADFNELYNRMEEAAEKKAKPPSAFDAIPERKVKRLLEQVEKTAYWAARYQCYVVIFKCEKCERWYEDEKGAAREKAVRGGPDLCLRCDEDATAASVTAVKMYGTWVRV